MNVDLVLRFVLPYIDIAGYTSAVTVCRCAYALKWIVDMPLIFQWADLDEAAPEPAMRLLFFRWKFKLEVHAGEDGLYNKEAGLVMRHYHTVDYYAGSAANYLSHDVSFWCLLTYARNPYIYFQSLSDPDYLQGAVYMLIDLFEEIDHRPDTVRRRIRKRMRSHGSKAEALADVPAFVQYAAAHSLSSSR